MTEQKPVYSVTEHPDMSFAKVPHEDGMTYEFDLRQEVNPYLEKIFEKHHKAKSLPKDPSYVPPKRGAIFDYFFNHSGHVFFNLVVKKDGKEIGHRQVGFSADKHPDPEQQKKLKIGVPGYVFDQEKSDPSYHFNKTFQLSRKQFDNVVKFVEENIQNPPTYHWPCAVNCVRFTMRAAEAAELPNAKLMGGLVDLPTTTQAYLALSKLSEKVEKAAKKIAKTFSRDRQAPVPENKQDLTRQIANKKAQSRG